MTDSRKRAESLEETWSSLGRCLAVAAGALAAFLALLHHVPVWIASLRGAIAFFGVACASRAVRGVLAWAQAHDIRNAKPSTAPKAPMPAPASTRRARA
ncbi:MAG: hypothetical protein ACKVWV_18715 [Planctomycetota bacterium]